MELKICQNFRKALSWLSFVFHLKALTHTHSTPLISHDNVMGYHWNTVCMYVSRLWVGWGTGGEEQKQCHGISLEHCVYVCV